MFHKILVAHDGSEGAQKALLAALDLAAVCKAELHTISIIEVHSHFAATMGEITEEREEDKKFYQRVAEESRRVASDRGIAIHAEVKTGHEVETIIHYLRDNGYDLLVVGFMGHSRVFGRIWGGTSQNLAKLASCSVLVVK